jgi:hypothetical protein
LKLQLWVGVVYTQNFKGAVEVYIDDIAAGDGVVAEEGDPRVQADCLLHPEQR